MTRRIFYYDALRALAIIGIIFCHASISYVLNISDSFSFYISVFFNCFRDFSIPIFVMLSGALLIGKKDTLSEFFKKRLSRIFIPFIFWAAVYIIFASAYMNSNQPLDIILGNTGSIGVIFWFIWMITISYIGIFIINKTFGQSDRSMLILTAIAALFIIGCEFNLINPNVSRITYYLSFMAYIIIGYFLANNLKRNLIIPALVIFTGSYLYYVFEVINISILNNHFPQLKYFSIIILLMSASLFLFFKYLSEYDKFKRIEDKTIGKIIKIISQYSFGIYLSHYLILIILKNALSAITDYTSQSPLFWIPFLVILSLTISLTICHALSKLPYIGQISGKTSASSRKMKGQRQ